MWRRKGGENQTRQDVSTSGGTHGRLVWPRKTTHSEIKEGRGEVFYTLFCLSHFFRISSGFLPHPPYPPPALSALCDSFCCTPTWIVP